MKSTTIVRLILTAVVLVEVWLYEHWFVALAITLLFVAAQLADWIARDRWRAISTFIVRLILAAVVLVEVWLNEHLSVALAIALLLVAGELADWIAGPGDRD